jgi:hypothetical protein
LAAGNSRNFAPPILKGEIRWFKLISWAIQERSESEIRLERCDLAQDQIRIRRPTQTAGVFVALIQAVEHRLL